MKKEKTILDDIIIVASPVLLLIFWQLACSKNWVNYSILPSPTRILDAFKELWGKGRFQSNLWASVRRVLIGFAFGSLSGIILGFVFSFFRKANDVFSVLFKILRSIPAIGMIPLFILWLGIGEETKIVIIALSAFWAVLLNTERGITSTDSKLLEVGTIFEKNTFTVLTKIFLPSAFPSILTGLRLAISASWRSVVAAEMIASMTGIGYMISYARSISAPDMMFVGLITLGILGLFLDSVLLYLEKKIIKWN